MLLILAALLIPVMFSIASSVTRQAPEAGAIATVVSLLLSLLTLYPIATRVRIPYFSAVFYLPVPFAITALSALTAAIPFLPLALIPALAASILTATGAQGGARSTPDRMSSSASTGLQDNTKPSQKFILAIAGIAILFFTLASFSLALEEDLASTLRILAIMAVLAQFAFLLGALDFSRALFFTAVEIVVYAVIALLPLIAAGTFAGGMGTMLPFSFKILTYPFAIAIFLRAAMLHNAGVHPLIFLVMLFFYHAARIFTVEPAWQIFAFFIFPLVLPWFGSAFDERKQKIYLIYRKLLPTKADRIPNLSGVKPVFR